MKDLSCFYYLKILSYNKLFKDNLFKSYKEHGLSNSIFLHGMKLLEENKQATSLNGASYALMIIWWEDKT